MTRRAAAATTANRSGSRSSASGDDSTAPAEATRSRAATKRAARKAAAAPPATKTRARKAKSRASDPTVEPAVAPRRRGRARRGDGDQLREEILDATHALLVETGSADKVSTRAVAQRVGCSSPALYLHFADKAELLFAVCNRQFQRLRERTLAAIEGIDDPIDALWAVGRSYVGFGVDHPEEYRVMMMVPDTAIWNPPYEDLPNEAGFDILLDLLVRAMAEGRLREDDPVLVAITVWTTVHGLVALRIAKPAFEWPDLDDLTDRTLTMLVVGLGPRVGDADPPAPPDPVLRARSRPGSGR